MDRGYLAPASLVLEVKSGNEVSRSLDQHTPFEPFCFVIGDREALKIREYNGSWLLHNSTVLDQFASVCGHFTKWCVSFTTWRNLTQPASDGYLLPFLYPTKRTHVASPRLRQGATYTTETLEWSRWLKMGLSAAKLGKAVLSADAWPRGASVRSAGSQALRVRRTREQLRKDSYAIYIKLQKFNNRTCVHELYIYGNDI